MTGSSMGRWSGTNKPRGGRGSNQYVIQPGGAYDATADEQRSEVINRIGAIENKSLAKSFDDTALDLANSLESAYESGDEGSISQAESDVRAMYPYPYSEGFIGSVGSDHYSDDDESHSESCDAVYMHATDVEARGRISTDELAGHLSSIERHKTEKEGLDFDEADSHLRNQVVAHLIEASSSNDPDDHRDSIAQAVNEANAHRVQSIGL